MAVLQLEVNKKVMLQCIVKNINGDNINQPANYPKVNIFKMEDTGATEVLASTVMDKHLDGEYYYEWDGSSSSGTYKAKYEAIIDGQTYFGYDTIILQISGATYKGWGV